MRFINFVNKYLFNYLIHVTHWLTKKEGRYLIGRPFLRFLGSATLLIKRGKHKSEIGSVGREWQKMFPSKKMVPVVKEETDTVFAEIRTTCPYRGSGNVAGCYRMMEYDRKMLETIGADFVVLRSQAEPGVDTCLVAMTRDARARADLIPAHERAREGERQD